MKTTPRLILGTRGSALALAQTTLVKKLLRTAHSHLFIEEKIIATTGDTKPSLPIYKPVAEASGLFTRQLEEALLSHNIDAAVHSLKDLPVITRPGLQLAAILPRASTSDLLITRKPADLVELPSEAVIGTSAPRRSEYLRYYRPDITWKPVRGNVPTRLRKLTTEEFCSLSSKELSPQNETIFFDGLILAQAGLERLEYGLELTNGKGTFLFEGKTLYATALSTMLPAPGQGAIAVETRAEALPPSASFYLAALHDEKTSCCVTAERLLLHYLGGGCHMALGALATIDKHTEQIHLKSIYFPHAGAAPRHGEALGATPEEVALLVATQLGDKLATATPSL